MLRVVRKTIKKSTAPAKKHQHKTSLSKTDTILPKIILSVFVVVRCSKCAYLYCHSFWGNFKFFCQLFKVAFRLFQYKMRRHKYFRSQQVCFYFQLIFQIFTAIRAKDILQFWIGIRNRLGFFPYCHSKKDILL